MQTQAAADLIKQGMAHHTAGRLDAAETLYRRSLAVSPAGWDAPHLLGLIANARGRHNEAVDWVTRAVKARPAEPVFWFNLGNVLAAAGRDAEAVQPYQQAATIKPDFVDAHVNLANALERLGRLQELVPVRQSIARWKPADPDAHVAVGLAYHRLAHFAPAAAAYGGAILLAPDHAVARKNLAVALTNLRHTDEAIATARTAARLDPAAASNLLLTLQYSDTIAPADVFAEHVAWGERHPPPPRPPRRAGGGRLRVGYVSGDLRDHPVGTFALPLLEHHDRDRFEVFCYANRIGPDDAVTAALRSAADQWRDVRPLSDEAAAALVAADGINVLVDLSGHTAENRLGLFARRPAAVQATYLGYPATTGLRQIDCRITDAIADPPGMTESLYAEQLVRLPRCFLCYAPPADAPAVADPTGPVTFASFNATVKVSPTTVRLWAAVLTAVPDSRLAVKALGFMDVGAQQRLRGEFRAAGVDPGRLLFWPVNAAHRDHLAQYGRVDVALDTFPYGGTTTTADALWMGVPVVTLAGPTHASRVGASMLTAAGLSEWVAETPERFVEVAARAAVERGAMRHGMRDRLLASELCDAAGFVRAVEAAYERMVARAV